MLNLTKNNQAENGKNHRKRDKIEYHKFQLLFSENLIFKHYLHRFQSACSLIPGRFLYIDHS